MSARRVTGVVTLWLALMGGCGRGTTPRTEAPPGKPLRIASLTVATDEILADLVPTDRVVTVTHLADDPGISNVAGRYPERVARVRDANLEPIVAAAPDLVCVASYNTADSLELLRRSGLSIYRNESVSSIDGIEAGIARLAERVGEPGRGRAMVERMQERRRRLADRLRDLPDRRRPRVLFWSAGFTAGRDSTIDDIIRDAGGINAARELDLEGSAEIAPERVVALDPEYVILAHWKADDRQGQIANHPILRQLRAVREDRVIAIESRFLTSLSQYVVEGAERLARALHPGRFPDGAAP